MISIKVNGNRSDVAGYLSFYSSEMISELVGCKEEEITYESSVNDYFFKGDITEDIFIEVNVTMPDVFEEHIHDITNIIVKYVGFFTNKCRVYYNLIEAKNIFIYDVSKQHDDCHDCDHEEDEHEYCEDHDCDCDEDCHNHD